MALARLSDYLIPLLLAGAAVYALGRRVDVFSALTTGAGEGLHIVLRILPPLVALLTAVYMLRASGALEALTRGLTPALAFFGHPAGDGGAAADPPGQRQRGSGCRQRDHADLWPGQRRRPHGGGDAGEYRDYILHRGGILRRCGHPPHPTYHPGGSGGGHHGFFGRGLDGKMVVLKLKSTGCA